MKPRIFMGFTSTVGYFANLSEALSGIGVKNVFVAGDANPFNFKTSEASAWIMRIHNFTRELKYNGNKFTSKVGKFTNYIVRFPLFIWALFNFDVFIFGANASFFNLYDLKLLKFFNKKIMYVYLGSDSRPTYMSGVYLSDKEDFDLQYIIEQNSALLSRIHKVNQYADYIIDHTTTAFFHKRPVIKFLNVGIPQCFDAGGFQRPIEFKEKIRIVHAPTRPEGKGTPYIRKVVQRLKDRGYEFTYIELIGRPNEEVLHEISCCDFVIDQLYSDTPLAGLALEAAMFKKPSVVGSYYYQDIFNDHLEENIPPNCFCHPNDLEKTIVKLIENSEYRLEMGEKIYNFATTKWNAKSIAQKYIDIIADDVSDEWYISPQELNYIYGWGVHKDKLLSSWQQIIQEYGMKSLGLNKGSEAYKKISKLIIQKNSDAS